MRDTPRPATIRCMRVLHVIDSLGGGGGAEHALRIQLPELARRDVTSEVVCLKSRSGPLADLVRQEGTPVTILRPGSRLSQAKALRRFLEIFKPDLVHATLFESCLLSRLATPRAVPLLNSLVSTSYAPVRVERLGASPVKRRLVWLVDRATVHLVDHFHVLTKAVRSEARTVLGVSADKITVIPRGRSAVTLGVRSDERRHEVRAKLGIDTQTPLLINVGRQEPPKGQAALVRAFAHVRMELRDAVLLIVGREGNASMDLAQAVSELGLPDSVRVLGYRSDVADLVSASDLFVFPSVYEGLGSALIEAMGVGTPIVATDIPAVREVLADGSAGRLTKPGDLDMLARTILELIGDPTARAELAHRGSQRFQQAYTLGAVVDQTAELYCRLVRPAFEGI